MAVLRTDQWLLKHDYHPEEVCREIFPYFKDAKEKELIQHLQHNGMYHSSSQGERDCKLLVEEDVWSQVEVIYEKYKKEWGGPDVPIFIFPMKKQSFFRRFHFKSGLAYADKLFLFLSPKLHLNHLEALLIHEYHHVCRIEKQKKPVEEYTVADAIILEGCAEYTVKTIKGEKYLAPWTKQYSAKFLQSYWESAFKKDSMAVKGEIKHDQLLYGGGLYPAMIGYCMGFHLVESYAEEKNLTIQSSFLVPTKDIFYNYSKK